MIKAYLSAKTALQEGNLSCLITLLEKHPGLARYHPPVDELGHRNTLLHEVTGMSELAWPDNAADLAQLLINHGARVDARENLRRGETPLIHAVSVNNVEVAEVLLENGADIEKTGRYDDTIDTPLGYALFFGRDPRLPLFSKNAPELLCDSGAFIYLPFAAALHDNERARRFFEPDGSLKPEASPSAEKELVLIQTFFFACQYDNRELAEWLLRWNLPLDRRIPFFHHQLTILEWTELCGKEAWLTSGLERAL